MNTIALYMHPVFAKHISQLSHPENSERLLSIEYALKKTQLPIDYYQANPCNRSVLELVHPFEYLDALFNVKKHTHIDGDTYMCEHTMDAVLYACGGLVDAAENLLDGVFDKAMVIARPPGHHAEPNQSMGFCLVNNIAVLAKYLVEKKKIDRLAIIDFDVHHGNGTEAAVKGDDRILFCSTYQQGIYPPGTVHGRNENILNVPLQAFIDGDEYRRIFTDQVVSAVNAFQPNVILVSAGFDAHSKDPLAQINLENDDFYWLGEQINTLSQKLCSGRVISCLEGGYNLEVVGDSVSSYLMGLTAE